MKQPTSFTSLLIKGNVFESIATPTVVSTAGAATIVAASLINAIYDRECGAADRTDTTDTAALIIAGIKNGLIKPVAGTSFIFYVRNVSAAARTLTIAGGTGVTIQGTATVAQNAIRAFMGIVTDPKALTISLYSLGSQAY